MALKEKVFLNRDNAITLGFVLNGAPVDASNFTRFIATLTDDDGNEITIDSNSDIAVFSTTTQAQVSDTVINVLKMKLQSANTPPPARADYTCRLVVYDSANPNGLDWDSPFPVEVVDS